MNEITPEIKKILDAVLDGYECVNPDLTERDKQSVRLAVLAGCGYAQDREMSDMLAFIDWSHNNGRRPGWIAGQLMHDLNGIALLDGPCFVPRTAGYSDLMTKGAKNAS